MKLKTLHVEGFRNLNSASVQFSSPSTLLYGDNAQGKTNLLEAVYLLGTTRSFRENRTRVLINDKKKSSLIKGNIEHNGIGHSLAVELSSEGKYYTRDGSSLELAEYVKTMPVVVLCSEDKALINGLPRNRRRLLDAVAVWRRPAYLERLLAFGGCLRQRNKLLKAGCRQAGELDAWTETFVALAREVRQARENSAARLNEKLAAIKEEAAGQEKFVLRYRPSGGDNLRSELERVRKEEIDVGVSLVGPQRDRVDFLLDGRSLRSYGSSGQARTALWMIKLSSLLVAAEEGGTTPIFLLDDVEAELDNARIESMVRLTSGRAQLMMTATKPLATASFKPHHFRIVDGRVYDVG